MPDLIYPKECYAIVGACFNVYNEKGCSFLEPVYQECLEIELAYQETPSVAQRPLKLSYRGRTLRQHYTPDFICYDTIIVEIKAVSQLVDEHRAQVQNYLHSAGMQLRLLVNLGHYPKLEYERIVMTTKKPIGVHSRD